MEITIIIRDTEDGLVDVNETRLPYSGETIESVTTASVLADELNKSIRKLEEVTACGITVIDDDDEEWEQF